MRANRPKARLTSGFCRLSSAGFTAAFGVVAVLGVLGVLAVFGAVAAFGVVAVFGLLAAFGVAPAFGVVAARGCCTDATAAGVGVAGFGVAAAINDTVRSVEHNMLLMLYAAVFLMCVISFRNPLAALCIVLPLVLVTEFGHSLMVHMGIGMKINTLTVVALGVGIGVDYGIYIYARMAEAMKAGKSLTESYFIALKTTGIAIFYTALTLAVGVAMWIFSELKFQADMGLMLTFMFVVNMFAALIFLPALCRWLLRPGEKDTWVPPAS